MKDVKIKIKVDTSEADNAVLGLDSNITKLNKTTDKSADSSKEMSKGLKDVADNGGAIAVLDSITGGLASKLRDGAEASKLFNFNLKAMRGALIATGLGALVVAVGTIVAYWDDIVDYITQANKKLQKQIDLHKDQAKELTTELGFNEQIQKSLELQGLSVKDTIKDKILLMGELQKELVLENTLLAIQYNKAKAEELTFMERLNALSQEDGNFEGIITKEESDNLKAIGDQINANQKAIIDYANTKIELTQELEAPVDPIDPVDPKNGDTTTNTDADTIDKEVLTEEEKQARIQEVKDYYFLKGLEREISEIERKAEADIAELEALGAHKSLIEQIEQDSADKIASITKTYSDRVVTTAEDTEDKKMSIAEIGSKGIQTLNNATSGLMNALGKKDGEESEKQAKKNFEVQKSMKLATGAMSVTEGAINAFSQTTDPSPTQTLRMINGGVAAAIGLANLATIASTTFDGGGKPDAQGGTQGGNQGGNGGAIDPPTFNLVEGSADNQIQQSIQNAGDTPVKAYVVASDVTSQQGLDRQIENSATI